MPGRTYDDAVNYGENATVDDGSMRDGAGGLTRLGHVFGDLNADAGQINDLLGLLTVYGNDCNDIMKPIPIPYLDEEVSSLPRCPILGHRQLGPTGNGVLLLSTRNSHSPLRRWIPP